MSNEKYEKMNELGRWIARSRYTREEFAKMMGVSLNTILGWCSKQGISQKHVRKVSKVTGIPVDKLVVRKEAPAEKETLTWGGCWVE